jgi:hypothetical protein
MGNPPPNPPHPMTYWRTPLGELIVDEQLDDAGLDEFMARARALADQLTA